MDELPRGVLVSIVSLLPIKEGSRTSFLARCFENLWRERRILNFDASELLYELGNGDNSLKSNRRAFVNWVDGVILLHSGITIDEFAVQFNLDRSNARGIDKWIEFALERRVQILKLSFESKTRDWRWGTFQEQWLEQRMYIFPDVTKLVNVSAISLSLVSVSLTSVFITEDNMESLMSKCRTLENLHLENAKGLESFSPSCQGTRLRHLSIINCTQITRVDICSLNLVSYTFVTPSPTITELKGASSLTHLTLGALTDFALNQLIFSLSSYFPQLETLTIQKPRLVLGQLQFPILPRLKKLVIQVDVSFFHNRVSFMAFARAIINAAPLLHEVVLKLMGGSFCDPRRRRPQLPAVAGQKHGSLQVLEIEGFSGIAIDVELALYVLEHAPLLEMVVINGVVKTDLDHYLKEELLGIVAGAAQEVRG